MVVLLAIERLCDRGVLKQVDLTAVKGAVLSAIHGLGVLKTASVPRGFRGLRIDVTSVDLVVDQLHLVHELL